MDNNGHPLVGGQVYFYIPNTSTKKDTWQDEDLTILNTNPVLLDSSGSAVIWGAGAYRQVVYDVNGILIWDKTTGSFASMADLQAVATDFAGATDPATVPANNIQPYMTWADISVNPGLIKRRNAANSAWFVEGKLFVDGGIASSVDVTPSGSITATNVQAALEQIAAYISPIQGTYKNLKASATGTNASVSVSVDAISLINSTNAPYTARAVSLTINSAASGANGLDTGTLAASSWYSVWVISDGTTTAGLLSLSATSPTLPTDYTFMARVGWIRTDASANKYPLSFIQAANRVQYKRVATGNVTQLPTIAGGVVSFGPISVSPYFPVTAATIVLHSFGNPISGQITTTALSAAYDISDGSLQFQNGSASVNTFAGNVEFIPESTNVYWGNNSANGYLLAVGWTDNL